MTPACGSCSWLCVECFVGLPQREGVPGDTRSAASLLSATKGRHYYVSQHQTDTTTHQSEEYARAAPLSVCCQDQTSSVWRHGTSPQVFSKRVFSKRADEGGSGLARGR